MSVCEHECTMSMSSSAGSSARFAMTGKPNCSKCSEVSVRVNDRQSEEAQNAGCGVLFGLLKPAAVRRS